MMNINVDQGEFKIAQRGFTLVTGAAGPCIIIGIYDQVNKMAYMIHEDSASHKGELSNFIEAVKSSSKPENLLVKVRGGSCHKNDPHFNEVERNRQTVINALNQSFNTSRIDVIWRESCMEIDTETGKFLFRCM